MSTAPDDIVRLVRQFDEHRDTYLRGDYNETQLRRDFVDPLFAALGWDVHNVQGYAEAYRDVIHEDSLRVEKSVKAPDYGFRIGGVRKFFVEAKRPSVDVRRDATAAFQLRRYAWTAKLPLSILTDFEDLAVYDCRVKPDKLDKASTARVFLFHYTEIIDRWDEIAGIFSREAILHGAFDRYAESTKKKRGTAEVDEAFLQEIESWRESLARNLSLRNEELSDRQLNFAVQRIIDRIIFLRMCEGRGIEHFGQLQALLNGPNVYRLLVELFHRADEKYNSGLFHFQREKGREAPDELTTRVAIDDKTLKDIIVRLYYPESPYEFAALPADILGQVYEQFLGKVIRLTAGHHAKVEEKPEVRKAGGVYYTPTYIVQYIVENTVGKLVEGKTPQEVGGLTEKFKPSKTRRPLTVLDPACGSGSFLIVAYQYLLDWYLKQYTEHDDPQKHARGANPRIYEVPSRLPSPSGRGAGGEGFLPSPSGKEHHHQKPPLPPDLLAFARNLRQTSTDAEKLLWGLLRNRRLGGFKFRRQRPEPPYVLDFYCEAAKLAIELDGGQHNEPSARRKDESRSAELARRGIRVLRFWNHEMLGDTDAVLEAIWYGLQGASPLTPDPSPKGRGEKTLTPGPSPTGRGGKGEWRLTTAERKRILLTHIYGVDIDYQAVEVTKLSLLLKVLEGETEATLQRQQRLFHKERALPDLANNIKCGNSLVGPDFYHDRQLSLLEEDERLRINAFDWHAEFPHILPSPSGRVAGGEGQHTGFDAVIGNPPYGASLSEQEVAYLRIAYANGNRELDTYCLFMEKAIRNLRADGVVGMIVPTGWYSGTKFSVLRRFMVCEADPKSFVNLPYDVFHAWVDTTVFVATKRAQVLMWPRRQRCPVRLLTFPKRHRIRSADEFSHGWRRVDMARWFAEDHDEYLTYADNAASQLITKVQSAGVPLRELADVQRGVTPFNLSPRPTHKSSCPAFSGSVRRYKYQAGEPAFIRFDDSLAEPKPERYFAGPRLLLRELISRQFQLQAVKVVDDFVTNKSMQSILVLPGGPDLNYLLGLLNSKLMSWYFLHKSNIAQRDDFPKIVLRETRTLPFRPIETSDAGDHARHDRMVNLVQQMLDLHKRLGELKTPHEQTAVQRQIDATDREIDRLVYELYKLTDEEIRIVEEGTARY